MISPPRTVVVVGLGLMGGSLARDLRARGIRVLGRDRDPETGRVASTLGVEMLRSFSREELAEADLVILAVPVSAAAELLLEIAPRLPEGCVVTDVGSTKRAIASAAEAAGLGERFVGSHPLAGDHRSGWAAAREGLFAGSRVYVCTTPRSTPAALARVLGLWAALGAEVELVSAETHDRQLAWTSHLPQLLSSALAISLRRGGYAPEQLGPGGRDMTRLAASSPEMWSAICLENHDNLGEALETLQSEISLLREALGRRDAEALERFLSRGVLWSASTTRLA